MQDYTPTRVMRRMQGFKMAKDRNEKPWRDLLLRESFAFFRCC
jgi:hypothetical protein